MPNSDKKKMIPLHSAKDFSWMKEGVRTQPKPKNNFYTEKELKVQLKSFGQFNAKMITDYLTLSAKTPFVQGKGFLNALNCQSVFPNDLNITFPWWTPQDHPFPTAGKIEIWLSDLEQHQNLSVEMRLTGFSNNSSSAFEVRSSLTGLYGYFPVAVGSKIDLFFCYPRMLCKEFNYKKSSIVIRISLIYKLYFIYKLFQWIPARSMPAWRQTGGNDKL